MNNFYYQTINLMKKIFFVGWVLDPKENQHLKTNKMSNLFKEINLSKSKYIYYEKI